MTNTENDQSCRAGDGIPAGFKLVPIELTDQMRDAGNEIVANRWLLSQAWRAMLAAAPVAAPAPAAPLDPSEIGRLYDANKYSGSWFEFARAIERAHGIQAPATAP